jgi:hypothetical protein
MISLDDLGERMNLTAVPLGGSWVTPGTYLAGRTTPPYAGIDAYVCAGPDGGCTAGEGFTGTLTIDDVGSSVTGSFVVDGAASDTACPDTGCPPRTTGTFCAPLSN